MSPVPGKPDRGAIWADQSVASSSLITLPTVASLDLFFHFFRPAVPFSKGASSHCALMMRIGATFMNHESIRDTYIVSLIVLFFLKTCLADPRTRHWWSHTCVHRFSMRQFDLRSINLETRIPPSAT